MADCCDNFDMLEDQGDSFETWQGLRGPYYTPSVDSEGNLSWTNNGGLPNPPTVNITGPEGEQAPVDDALSETSENPVQNKVIYGALNSVGDDVDAAYALASDAKSVVDEVSENLVAAEYTVAPNLYIYPSTMKFVSHNVINLIVLPISSNTKYKIWKKTSTVMRVATGTIQTPVSGDSFNVVAAHASASSDPLYITSGENDTYMYVQLYANSDPADLKSIDANVGSLLIQREQEDVEAQIDNLNFAVANNLMVSVLDSDSFEQGYYNNGVKRAGNYQIRTKDGFQVTHDSYLTFTPNGQYGTVTAWGTRQEVEGVISFSDRIDGFANVSQPTSLSVPAGCWVTLVVRAAYPDNVRIYPNENRTSLYIGDNQIFQNKADIAELAAAVGAVPEYWENEITDTETKINNNRLAIGNKLAEFFFLTDVHWYGNAQLSPALINRVAQDTGIRNVLVGGDIVYTHETTQAAAAESILSFYKKFNDGLRLFSTIGNHDLNSNNNADTTSYLSPNQIYPFMFAEEETYTDTGADPLVTVYDNPSQKVRFIQFYHPDAIEIPQTVQTAVEDAIKAKDPTWTVVLLAHVYWTTNDTADQYITAFTEALALLNAGGAYAKIAALIVGHKHKDFNVQVGGNLLVIGSQCDIYRQSSGADMTAGTDSEQAIDVFQIDTEARKIYITRLGAGNDREFTY